jgi:hypothetical protein
LRKKLKWYAENQQLLDKDAALLKQKDEEIKQLKLRLEDLSTDVSVGVIIFSKNCKVNLCCSYTRQSHLHGCSSGG